ncbi:MAG: (R)-stereoselective amidase [bacterium ADurb.Bin429]|nr:MAG: (R)-stereoselective amidase [bacterium ADurb.Bin429]
MQLTVALLQLASCGMDQQANLVKGEDYCRRAADAGADIALFPEMWNIGYTFATPTDPDAYQQWLVCAVEREDAYLLHFRALARELGMAIAITYLERWQSRPRNTVSLIDRRGQVVLTYAKVHTCEFGPEAVLTPGDAFPVTTLETAQGQVQVGTMICYDREFPESARILMLNGAEVILVPNACNIEENRKAQLRTRAYENMLGVAMANYAAPQNNGHSIAFDGIVFEEVNGTWSTRDHCLLQAGEEEGIYMANFDLRRMRAYREKAIWGNAYRRPRYYQPLIDGAVAYPFLREDATR